MINFTCPMCDTDNEVSGEDLPDRVCDDAEYTCKHCDQEMTIGWVASVEVRSVKVEAGDLVDDDFDYETDHNTGN